MPGHEKFLDTATDTGAGVSDLVADAPDEFFAGGLRGRTAGPVEGATTVDTEAEGVLPIGIDPGIPLPTGVSAADHATAGQGTVTVTGMPAGATGVQVITRLQSSNAVVKRQTSATSPIQVTGLANAAHDFYVRGYLADGAGFRVGRFATKVSATIV